MQAAEQLSSETFRYYMSENTDHHQFSRMINLKKKKKQKNIILNLPQAVSPPPLHHHHHHPHQFYSYGYGDIFFSDPLMLQTDNTNILNANDEISSIYMESNLYSQKDQFDEEIPFSSQPYINNHCQSAASAVPSMKSSVDEYYCCPSFHLNMKSSPTTTTATLPGDYDHDIYMQQQEFCCEITSEMNNFGRNNYCNSTRKRIPQEIKPFENDRKSNKRVAAEVYCPEQSQDYQFLKDIKQVHKERTPVRKSQKLADRITALQKLVSPYGKTDTASVLYEASIFIKVLQDQIQNIFNTLPDNISTQQKKNRRGGEEKELDLRNKGLCLVPLLLTQKLVGEALELEEEQLWMPSLHTTVLHEN